MRSTHKTWPLCKLKLKTCLPKRNLCPQLGVGVKAILREELTEAGFMHQSFVDEVRQGVDIEVEAAVLSLRLSPAVGAASRGSTIVLAA
jgi:hypothetical protein